LNDPVTELDSRFSDPAAVAAGWEETRRTLAVAVWFEGALYFCTGDAEQKAVNLRGNPHVILMTGCNGWEAGLDVVVEGNAVPVTDKAVLRSLAQAWAAKWDGQWQFQVRDGSFQDQGDGGGDGRVLVFKVAPAKVLAFAKGAFSQTRHSFS
jgi:hypothetical protein